MNLNVQYTTYNRHFVLNIFNINSLSIFYDCKVLF